MSSQRCVRIVILGHILNINTECLYCRPLHQMNRNGFAYNIAQTYSMTDHIFSHYFSKSQVLPIISAVFKDKSVQTGRDECRSESHLGTVKTD